VHRTLELPALRDTLSAASTIARINLCKWVGAAQIQEHTGLVSRPRIRQRISGMGGPYLLNLV